MKKYFKISILIIGTTLLFFFVSSCGNSKGNKNNEQKDTVDVNSKTNKKTEYNCVPKEIKENFFAIKKLEITNGLSIREVLLKLFPGTLCYDNTSENDTSYYISWTCPSCPKKITYLAEDESKVTFPYDDFNETRSTNEDILYINDAGHETAIVPFSTSMMIGGRFQPGILGLAYFYRSGSNWSLKYFDPAISYGGMFGIAPMPKEYLKLNNNVWGCYTDDMFSGGACPDSGFFPNYSWFDVYAPLNNKLANILQISYTGCTNQASTFSSNWSSFFIVSENSNNTFNDLILVTTGRINLDDYKEEFNDTKNTSKLLDFIKEIKNNASNKNPIGFVMQRKYSFQKNSYSLTSTNIQTY